MIIKILKLLYSKKNGNCSHESLWKTSSGFCYVCKDEIPRDMFKKLSELTLLIKKL